MSAEEVWRPVLGYEGYYEVSNLGRVQSVERLVARRNCNSGTTARVEKGRILVPVPTPLGYPRVHLSKEGRRWKAGVHILVCEAFHGPRPEGMEAAHNDSDPANCHADNLRWDTPAGNAADKVGAGTLLRGSKHPFATITEEMVRTIRTRPWNELPRMAEQWGVGLRAVQKAWSGETWRHI